MHVRRVARLFILVACAGSAACSAILGLEAPPEGSGSDASTDTTTNDGTTGGEAGTPEASAVHASDAGTDGPVCLALDAGGLGNVAYNALHNATLPEGGTTWEFFEPNSVNVGAHDFQGGTFDGRYIYFAPNSTSIITRYDTTLGFDTGAAWSVFDVHALSVPAGLGFFRRGLRRPLRLLRCRTTRRPQRAYTGTITVRFDKNGSFTTNGPQWTVFDLTTLPLADAGTLVGFAGGTYDGQNVYLVPDLDQTMRVSRVIRYTPALAGDGGGVPVDAGDAGDAGNGDAGHDGGVPEAGPPVFSTEAAFSAFDLTTKDNAAAGYVGAVFDGHFTYLAPLTNNSNGQGIVARYDTTLGFTTGTAWGVFDLTAINTDAVGFNGASFDGRYVYLVPHNRTIVARYDTKDGVLSHATAWSTFDLSTVTPADAGTPAISGGAFDGRFVYFVPNLVGGSGSGGIVRYDTFSTFDDPCAWTFFDSLDPRRRRHELLLASRLRRAVPLPRPARDVGRSLPDQERQRDAEPAGLQRVLPLGDVFAMKPWVLASVLGACALFGCSPANVGGGDAGPSPDTACGDSAFARCSHLQSCSPTYIQLRYGDVATCEANTKASCLASLAAPSSGSTPASSEACSGGHPELGLRRLHLLHERAARMRADGRIPGDRRRLRVSVAVPVRLLRHRARRGLRDVRAAAEPGGLVRPAHDVWPGAALQHRRLDVCDARRQGGHLRRRGELRDGDGVRGGQRDDRSGGHLPARRGVRRRVLELDHRVRLLRRPAVQQQLQDVRPRDLQRRRRQLQRYVPADGQRRSTAAAVRSA